MRAWPILFVLCAMTLTHAQSVEVPVASQLSIRTTVEVSHVRGYLADPIGGRIIPQAVVALRKKEAGVFVDVQSVESGPTGEFDFGRQSPGIYQLVASARGFCLIAFPVRVSKKGCAGLRVALPIRAAGPSWGSCRGFKVERSEE